MPSFKDDSILIIAPGSRTTLAQLGLPESFTPARFRFRSRMFAAEREGEWEPHRVRKKRKQNGPKPQPSSPTSAGTQPMEVDSDEPTYEEDFLSDEGAVWPIQSGHITNWSCFCALLEYIHQQIGPSFHTPILLIAQPVWTPKEHEKITQFVFENFKCPGFALVDSAVASCYAHGLETACVVDVGADKADITAIYQFIPSTIGRGSAVAGCGGEAMTERLHDLLASQGFSKPMCEQLKMSAICEILPPGVPLPGAQVPQNGPVDGSKLIDSSINNVAQIDQDGIAPRVPPTTSEQAQTDKDVVDEDGILDVAGLVAGGKMNEYLAKKEKEKQDKLASRKKGEQAANQPKQVRLKNSEKQKATFMYEDHALLNALKDSDMNSANIAEASATLDEGSNNKVNGTGATSSTNTNPTSAAHGTTQVPRRELTVGIERFKPVSDRFMTLLTGAIYNTIHSHPNPNSRSDLWNNLIVVGNGSGIRGFKEALLASLHSQYIISPSSATMFTSELPSNLSTPAATGTSTPIPVHGASGAIHGSQVNPLLHAATTAAAAGQHLHPPNAAHPQGVNNTNGPSQTTGHSSHGQSPTSIKLAKIPEYFSEWKDIGSEEAAFLGAQVTARVLFVVNSGTGSDKGYMSRTEYNENGPSGISDYSM